LIKATNFDTDQIGVEWLGYHDIKEKTVYPEVLKKVFDEQMNIMTPLYLGDSF
jgi:hypothetical protein